MGQFFGNRWWVVVASMCGLLVGSGAINIFAFAVFMKPVTEDLHITRSFFSSAVALHSILGIATTFCLGFLLDRYGTRRVMIPGLLLCAIAVGLYSTIQATPVWYIYALFAFNGLVFVVQSPIAYSNVVAQWFDRNRGLALGIATAGVGLGVALVPQLAQFLIREFGWREGYIGLGIAVLVVAWLPVSIFLREPAAYRTAEARIARRSATAHLPGTPAMEAFRTSGRFWILTLAFCLAVIAINGTLTHLVALLTDRGIPVQAAVAALSAAGIALILGRVLAGWCLDRFWGPYVAIVCFAIPMVGIALFASGAGGVVPTVGAVLCGIGIGAEVDLMAFFVSRYFGMKEYAKIYGVMFGFFVFATGVAPFFSGLSFDWYHSYVPIFAVYEVFLAITCLLFIRLGPYPYPAPKRDELPGEPQKLVT
jgi:MFS family permease